MGSPDFDQAARRLAIDLPRHDRYRCRQPHFCGLGMGQLVLPSSPTPMACACKDIVTVGGCRCECKANLADCSTAGPAATECSCEPGRIGDAHAQRLDETPAFEGDAFDRGV